MVEDCKVVLISVLKLIDVLLELIHYSSIQNNSKINMACEEPKEVEALFLFAAVYLEDIKAISASLQYIYNSKGKQEVKFPIICLPVCLDHLSPLPLYFID